MATNGGPPQSFEFSSSTDPSPVPTSGNASQHQSMTDSRYGDVVFKDVSDSYPTDGDIVIRYVNKSGEEETADDTIGMFPIGWKRIGEAVVTLKASDHVVEEGTYDKKLVMSSSLFADKVADGQFYQICYVNYKQKPYGRSIEPHVIGASCPFMIRKASEEDMVMVADRLSPRENNDGSNEGTDDEEFIVVKSEQALIQERLEQLVTNNGLLEYQYKSTVQKLVAAEKELASVKAEKAKFEGLLKSGQETIQHVTNLLSEVRKKETAHEKTVANLATENNRLNEQMRKMAKEIESLREERHIVTKKGELLKTENSETMNLVSTLLDEKERWLTHNEKLIDEKGQLARQLEVVNKELDKARTNMKQLVEQRDADNNVSVLKVGVLESQYTKARNELSEMKQMVEVMTQDLRDCELKLENELKSNVSVKSKVEEQESTISDLTRRLKKAAEEYVELKKSKSKTDVKYENLKQKIKFLKPSTPASSSAPSAPEAELSTSPPNQSTGAIPKIRTSIQQQQGSDTRVKEVENTLTEESGKVDADIVTLPCSLCKDDVVCTVKDMRAMTIHLEQVHKQRVCPVCSQLFDESMEGINEYFHLHVENHFDVPHIYPSLGSGFEAIGGAN